MRRPLVSTSGRSGSTVVLGASLALALAAGACGDDKATSSEETSAAEPSTEVPLRRAAATVQELLETGERVDTEPGACPYGPTADLALLLPDEVEVRPALRAGDVDDDGQLYFGEPAIVYCPIRASDASIDSAEIDEFRVDVAYGAADFVSYLEQNFATVDAGDLASRPELLGGDVTVVCHSDGCSGAWNRQDLFVAVTLIDGQEPSATADDAEAALGSIVPVVVDRLAALGTQREELAALARSYWADIYDDAIWDAWDAMLLSGDPEAYQQWIDFEVGDGSITAAQGEELLELLNALPGDGY